MSRASDSSEPGGEARFTRRALIVIALLALAFVAWQLRTVIVLLFGAAVMAAIVRAIAHPFTTLARIPERIAVVLAVLLLLALLAGVAFLLGRQIAMQANTIATSLPSAVGRVDQWLQGFGLNHPLQSWIDQMQAKGGTWMSRVGGWVSSASTGVADFLIVFFGGMFLATEPSFYRTGAIKLVPEGKRALVATAMDESARALRLWLKGQLMAMVIIGAMTGAGLWLLGNQSWLVLGLLAGFFEFIPFAGPIISAIPAVLIAFVQGPQYALWTTLMYVFVQHSEAYLIQPIIQQYAVDVPAVVLLFSLLAFGLLLGGLGVLFAAPLTVVTYVLVKRLYVRETLDTPTPIPGEN